VEVRSLYRQPAKPASELDWPALECIDVFKIFRAGGVETVALRGLDLRIRRGEFVAVLGRSGSGKSTFVRLSAGLEDASAGEVRALGRSLGRMPDRELAAYRARVVALVLQRDNLWSDLTARENVLASLRIAGIKDASRRADGALDAFGLGARSHHRPVALSGGEQQRVAIAAAASRQASVLLADEPTGELDAGNERIVLDALQQLRDTTGATIVTVTHSRTVAERADRIVTFVDGRVAES
jgi:putative ABC transport system ATP-binding protein